MKKALLAAAQLVAGAASLHAAQDIPAERLDALFTEYNQPGAPGAAVAVIKDFRIIYSGAFGLANVEEQTSITAETNFRLASFTKQFTAMAILILVDRGKLSLDSRLPEIIPEFPAYGRDITVRHLLNHTSGLLDYEDLMTTGTVVPLLDRDVLWILEQQDHTSFPSGSRFAYSNSGYAVLAAIVEKITGSTFAAFMKENIFLPLGMTKTLINERGISEIPNRAYGYSRETTGTSPAPAVPLQFRKTDQSLTSYVCGDGGIYSSTHDLFLWDQALYTTKLVKRELMNQMFAPGPAANDESTATKAHYGLGWYVDEYRGKKRVRHSGGTTGFSTVIERYPDDKFTIIMLINRTGADRSMTTKTADLFLPH